MATPNDKSDGNALAVGNLVNAADPLTKKVLSAYRHDVDYTKNLNTIRTFSCADLEAAASFFGASPGSYAEKTKRYLNRTTLADYIIIQLESHFPCDCEGCGEVYAVKLGESPRVRCFLCQQGSHGCAAMDGSIGSMSGSVWLCLPCKDKNNKIETFMGNRGAEDPEPVLSDEEYEFKISPKAGRSGKKNKKKKKKQAPVKKDTASDGLVTPVGGVAVLKDTELADVSSDGEVKLQCGPRFTNVCERYLLRDCPHGPKGDKLVSGKPCSKEHPQLCLRYCQYGTATRSGCHFGDKCQNFHPPLCHNSEISRVCTDKECKATHLKNTRRSEVPPKGPSLKHSGKKSSAFPQKEELKDPQRVKAPPSASQNQKRKKKVKTAKNETHPHATTNDIRSQEDFLMALMASVRDEILREVKTSLNTSLQSFREEMTREHTPRPKHLTLSQPSLNTPTNYQGVLERFRNYSSSTPAV